MEKKRQLVIGGFWSPPITKEHYQWVKDVGITHLMIDAKYDANPGTPQLLEAFKLCDEVGLKAYINSGCGMIVENDSNDYSQFESFCGWNADEPNMEQLDYLSKQQEIFMKQYPDKDILVNLFPSFGALQERFKTDYDGYLETFVEKIMKNQNEKVLSFDCYPLCWIQDWLNFVKDEDKARIGSGWLKNIEAIAMKAKKYNAEAHGYIATMSMWAGLKRRPSEADIRYQAYMLLAYGYTGIMAFCYQCPGLPPYDGEFKKEDYAMLNEEHERTEIWYGFQNVTTEIKKFQDVYLKYRWECTKGVWGTDKGRYPTVFQEGGERVEAFEKLRYNCFGGCMRDATATKPLVVGCLKNEEGGYAYMAVNYADPYYKQSNDIELTFTEKELTLSVYVNGEEVQEKITDGKYKCTLKEGEGRFIVVHKKEV